MLKTNIVKLKQHFTVGLAFLLAFCVLTVSVHAKDIVKYGDAALAKAIDFRDITDKAVKELHDHVDKQVLKSFAKTFSDGSINARTREDTPDIIEDDPGLMSRFTEHLLMWHVYATLPFSVSQR